MIRNLFIDREEIQMADTKKTNVNSVLIAIDIAKNKHDVLIKYSYSKMICHNNGYDLSTRISSKNLCH